MPTPFSSKNWEFMLAAHEAAKFLVYPDMFGVDASKLSYELQTVDGSQRQQIRDAEEATDLVVKVMVSHFRHPFNFTIGERWRRINTYGFADATFTEWNNATNLPSELYKINADFFVTGYFSQPSCKNCGWPAEGHGRYKTCARGMRIDDTAPCFWEVIACSVAPTKLGLVNKKLKYSEGYNERSYQDFIGVKFQDLFSSELVVYHGGTRQRPLVHPFTFPVDN